MNYGWAVVAEKDIVASRWQPRQDGYQGERFDGLVKSIEEHGIINPPKAFLNEEGVYELVTGHRRVAAARKAGQGDVPIDLMTDLRTLEEDGKVETLGLYHQLVLVDNLHHEDLTPIEQAKGIHSLMEEEGHTQQDVAKAMGKSQQWVSDRLALMKLAPEAQEAVTERAVEVTVAQKLAQLPEDVQVPVMKRIKGATSRDASKIIAEIKKALEPGFWDLPEDEPWRASMINVKRYVDHCLEQLRTLRPDKIGEVLNKLHSKGVLEPIKDLPTYWMENFGFACGIGRVSLTDWLKEQGHSCQTCIWREDEMWRECGGEDDGICYGFMNQDDPIRLEPLLEAEDCDTCKDDPGWCTDVGCYIEHVKAARAKQKEARGEHDLAIEIEHHDRLREFYSRQQEEDVDCDHWQAQACEHCRQFRGPDQRDQCGGVDGDRHVWTGFWTSGEVIVPRCSVYTLRDLSRLPEVSQSALREIMINWISEICCGYRSMGWLVDAEDKDVRGALEDMQLNQKQLASIVSMAVNANRLTGVIDGTDRRQMDPVTGEYSTWQKVIEGQDSEETEN